MFLNGLNNVYPGYNTVYFKANEIMSKSFFCFSLLHISKLSSLNLYIFIIISEYCGRISYLHPTHRQGKDKRMSVFNNINLGRGTDNSVP